MNIKKVLRKFTKYREDEDINIHEVKEIEKSNLKNIVLLDVRSPQEYEEEHIKRSNKYSII